MMNGCVCRGVSSGWMCVGVVFRMVTAWGSPVCACVRSPQWMCVGGAGGLQGMGVYVGVDASDYIEKKIRSTCSPQISSLDRVL